MPLSPPPDLPRTPPIPSYWAILDIAIAWASPRTVITVSTDSPVDLSLYASTREPTPEYFRALLRGAWVLRHVKWNCVGGFWFPQHELGDTTEHTFQLDGWPVGLPVWYYFDGRQNRKDTVSSSILFGSVRPPLNFNPGQQLSAQPVLVNPLRRTTINGLVSPGAITLL